MKHRWLMMAGLVAAVWIAGHPAARAGDLNSSSGDVQFTNHPAGASLTTGRALFLKNCAHCHGADARGDEGPDLHGLDISDQGIVSRIRQGKAGEMTAFAGKLQPSEINMLVAYLRSLKP